MLQLLNFTSLLQQWAAAVQGSCAQLVDFGTGSILRAVGQAVSSVALWLQWLILLVLQMARAQTSTGANLDSWVGQFVKFGGRLPSSPASTNATFSRFTPSASALILPGMVIQTAYGAPQFAVQTDTTNALWNVAQGGYLVPAGTASASVPVTAVVAGGAGNVQPYTITALGSAIPGIDTVTNLAAATGGSDGETDAQLLARFANWTQSLSRGTVLAIETAIQAVQAGLDISVYENTDPSGAADLGHFTAVVDDGSGSPSTALLTTCGLAAEAMRPVGSTYSVVGPTVATANVALSITTAPTSVKTVTIPAVQSAIAAYVSSLPIGAPLPLTKIAQIAYGAAPAVVNVTAITINSVAADLVPAAVGGAVRPGTVTVS